MKQNSRNSFQYVWLPVVMLMAACLCGCSTAHPSSSSAAAAEEPVDPSQMKYFTDTSIRDNCVALLDDLLGEEKHLSKVLLVKWETPKLEELVKDISHTAAEGSDFLKTLRPKEHGNDAPPTFLPPGEKAVREAIAKTKKDQLLGNKGAEFEFQLLLTQVQALNYGSHLAKVIAENEPHPARAREFKQLAAKLNTLYDRTIEMLKERA
jgi:hypothetical protein